MNRETYELLKRHGIKAVIKPKCNATSDTGSLSRSLATLLRLKR